MLVITNSIYTTNHLLSPETADTPYYSYNMREHPSPFSDEHECELLVLVLVIPQDTGL